MSRTISVEVELDSPAIKAAIEARASEMAAEMGEPDDPAEEFFEDMVVIRDALETVRRHLTSPKPNAAEAMIYVERALVALARIK